MCLWEERHSFVSIFFSQHAFCWLCGCLSYKPLGFQPLMYKVCLNWKVKEVWNWIGHFSVWKELKGSVLMRVCYITRFLRSPAAWNLSRRDGSRKNKLKPLQSNQQTNNRRSGGLLLNYNTSFPSWKLESWSTAGVCTSQSKKTSLKERSTQFELTSNLSLTSCLNGSS